MQREFFFFLSIIGMHSQMGKNRKKVIVMKKIVALFMVSLLTLGLIAGCSAVPQETQTTPAASPTATEAVVPTAESTAVPEEAVTIRLGGLTGPTSMGMVKLLSDAENGTTQNTYEFTLAGSADELTPKLLAGELDVLAVPLNLGAILYNNTQGAVQLLAVSTLGVIYIVEKGGETISSIEDLQGATIYATGRGSTPEYALAYLLAQHGLDINEDVTVEWKSEPTEAVAAMANQDHAVAMLPQPYVTVAQTQIEDLRVALDLTQEWEALDNGSTLITAGLLVRTEFAQQHPQAIAKFMEEYEASTEYVNANVAEAAQLVEHYNIVKAAIAEKAIPYCNIVYIAGQEMKDAVPGYLTVLYDQNPKAVGGTLPGDSFYYAP